MMRAAMIHEELLEQLLEDRRRKGLDKRDEVWAGVIHMVPPAASAHQLLSSDLLVALAPVAKRLGLRAAIEMALFDPRSKQGDDYRVPDLVIASPDVISKRGVEGKATLVVEILSPDDESRDKLPFYGRMGVREVWLIHPATRATEIFVLRDGALSPVKPRDGVLRSPALGVDLSVQANRLQVRDGETSTTI